MGKIEIILGLLGANNLRPHDPPSIRYNHGIVGFGHQHVSKGIRRV